MSTSQQEQVKPVAMQRAVYRNADDGQWYWNTGFDRPVGPFKTREEARDDFRNVMGIGKEVLK